MNLDMINAIEEIREHMTMADLAFREKVVYPLDVGLKTSAEKRIIEEVLEVCEARRERETMRRYPIRPPPLKKSDLLKTTSLPVGAKYTMPFERVDLRYATNAVKPKGEL